MPRLQAGHVFRGTQLATLICESPGNPVRLVYKMKDGKMVLIAYHLLESSIGAYIEWLVNELMMTVIKLNVRTHV